MTQEPQYVVEVISDALASDPEVAELGVHARVAGTDVFLQGQVATEHRRERVGRIVADLLPEHQIHNDLKVVDVAPDADSEELS
ncbi:MAG TPA: BON domain-containing protein [Acidimicrobiia bacterium]|jgi:osmotically-inducible protein OsmY